MNNGFYMQLAKTNIRKNRQVYLPYIFTGVVCAAMFYMIRSLSLNPGFVEMLGFNTLNSILGLACWVAGIFIVIFLLYTNSFLIKRRKKEFGVFCVLGMEKRHLSLTLFWETVCVFLVSVAGGLALGIALDKVLFMVLLRMLGEKIPLGFFLSRQALLATLALFGGIYLAVYLFDVIQIRAARPIQLLKGSEEGEREPRTKAVMALLGAACLGGGYYIAVTTENPMSALELFFVAVLLVMAGTYLLFAAGSIALLKLLRKNKNFYYQTRHFVSVSGMMYRMKQNAVGLANICILSTMVLVMVSATTSLWVGLADVQRSRYPMSINIYGETIGEGADVGTMEETVSGADVGTMDGHALGVDGSRMEELASGVEKLRREAGIEAERELRYRYLAFTSVKSGNEFLMEQPGMTFNWVDDLRILCFLPLEDYNAAMGTDYTLGAGQILACGARVDYAGDTLAVMGHSYRVAEHVKAVDMPINGMLSSNIVDCIYVVLPDAAEMETLYRQQKEIYGENASRLSYYYGVETAESSGDVAFYNSVQTFLAQRGFTATVECREAEWATSLALYGGLFFVGAFLGLLFVLATVLIIYYKQVSEGYEDRRRFAIMQQVGMTEKEVRDSIRSQVLLVFFLPLATAGVHMAFAFPIVSKLLKMLNLNNTPLYIACLVGCFLVFGIFYVVVYRVTTGTYNKIVQEQG